MTNHVHGPSYHEPVDIQRYAPHDLLFYVEHDPGALPNGVLDSTWLLNALPDNFLIKSQVTSVNLVNMPAVHLRQQANNYAQAKKARAASARAEDAATTQRAVTNLDYSLFCVRSDAFTVAEVYVDFYNQTQFQPQQLKAQQLPPQAQEVQPVQQLGIALTNGQGTIQHVFPNWYSGSAPHIGIGPHGPGGPPRPVLDPCSVERLRFEYVDRPKRVKRWGLEATSLLR